MSILQPMGGGTAYTKAGLFGPEKSGKSRTGMDLMCGILKYFNLPGPIVMFDTEGGSEYLAPYVKRTFGFEIIGVRSESYADLLAAAKEAEAMGASGFIADSITHPSAENRSAYMAGINAVRKAKRLEPRNDEIQDIAPIRAKWSGWVNWFKNVKMHVVVCGRQQNEWSNEVDEETGKTKFVKTGVRMRAENEFGYEPSLLVEMNRVQILGAKRDIIHRATVIADRFPDSQLTGMSFDDPTWEVFIPHLERLTPGAHAPVDTTVKTNHEINAEGSSAWSAEKRERTILWEEIEGELAKHWPSTGAADKKARLEILEATFGTRSTTKIEGLKADVLRSGLAAMRLKIAGVDVPAPVAKEEDGSASV